MGLESGEIKDEALSDSVPPGDPYKTNPNFIRLNMIPKEHPYGWQARFSKADYLQVMVHILPLLKMVGFNLILKTRHRSGRTLFHVEENFVPQSAPWDMKRRDPGGEVRGGGGGDSQIKVSGVKVVPFRG